MEQVPLFDDLLHLSLKCLHFDGHTETLLDNFKRINPKPEDFYPPHDPVVAACLGKHFRLAARLIDEGYGRITYDTVSMAEEELVHLMNVWVQEVETLLTEIKTTKATDRSNRVYAMGIISEDDNLHASWQGKNLHVFDSKWLQLPGYKTALNVINLANNRLQHIPGHLLWGLQGLQSLDISQNKIVFLPGPLNAELVQTSSLSRLDMSFNEIHYVPLEIFQLRNIETLYMQRNQITSLESAENLSRIAIGIQGTDLFGEWRCSKLKHLDLSHNRLDSLPSAIKGATSLTTLRLKNNNLKALPNSWTCPMMEIDASVNQISEVGNLHEHWMLSMEKLAMGTNRLKSFPSTLCSLVALTSLNLEDNDIKSLPDPASCKIYKLQMLNLSGNQLTNDPQDTLADKSQLQDSYSFLKSLKHGLQHLYLANNDLTSVPQSVCELHHLLSLDLRGNRNLHRLPLELAKLKNLVALQVDIDSLTRQQDVKEAVTNINVKAGLTETILINLKHGLQNSIPHRGMKMMVVGPAGSGKTTVLKWLTQARDFPKEDIPVNVYSWDLGDTRQKILSPKYSQLVKFKIWDVKGGDLYDIIQSCLYTDKGLYLLFWDANDGPDSVEQLHSWLVEIKRKAPESKVILVGTHRGKLQQNTFDEISAKIQKDLEEYIGSFCLVNVNRSTRTMDTLSIKTGIIKDEIEELKNLIYRHAIAMNGTYTGVTRKRATQPILGRKVPKAFLDLKNTLENRYRLPLKMLFTLKHLSKSPLKQVTESFSKDDLEEALDFLTECGTIIPIKIRSGRQLNVLDPVWLIRMQCQVAEVESKYVCDGRVSIETLAHFCNKCGLRKHLDDYLDLVEQLEIVVRVDMERRWFWIPATLPSQKPGIASPARNWPILRRYFKLPYIPPRFWIRLVSRLVISVKNLSQPNEQTDCRLSRHFTRQTSWLAAHNEEPPRSPTSSNSQWFVDDIPENTSSSYGSQHSILSSGDSWEAIPSEDSQPVIQQLTQSWQTAYFMTKSNRNLLEGLNLQIDAIMYWKEGVLVTHRAGRILVESHVFSDGKPGIRIQIHCERNEFREMGFIVDHIEGLLNNWYPEKEIHSGIVRLIPCPNCPDEEVFCLNVEDLIVSATYDVQKEVTFWCDQHTFLMKNLLPDVFLTDLKVDVLDQKQLPNVCFSNKYKLGSGGFGSVFRGNCNGEDVAVKTLVPNGVSLQSKAKIPELSKLERCDWVESFFMFRREVGMLSQLNHQHIIKMIGWACIQTLAFAMELAPEGDLSAVVEKEYPNFRERNPQGYIHDMVLERDLTYKIATQADWFSFAMLIYHILSGRWPFSDLKHAYEIEAATLEGTRPEFNMGTYKQRPPMPALVEVMERSWRDSPQDRPEGEDTMNAMADASFLCLREVIPLDKAVVYRLFTSSNAEYNASDLEHKPYLLHMWAGIRRTDSVVFRQKCLDDVEEMEGDALPLDMKIRGTSNIKCIAIYHSLHFIATLFDGVHVYESKNIEKYPEFQRQGDPLSTSQPVESMCYQEFKQLNSGRLFVGSQQKQLQIFTREKTGNWATPTTQLIDTAGDHPCSSMLLVADETQLWITCGNKIFIADITNPHTIAFVDSIQVVAQDQVSIGGMVYQQGRIWCFLNLYWGCFLIQYKESRECVGKLAVDRLKGVKVGDNLQNESVMDGKESLGGDEGFDDQKSNDFVQCLLVADDTLWIGTVDGDIIVVNINLGNSYGEVLGVLRMHHWLGISVGSVKHLVLCGPDRVVACQVTKRYERSQAEDGSLQVAMSRYQLVVWDRWDSKRFQWFEKAQKSLREIDTV